MTSVYVAVIQMVFALIEVEALIFISLWDANDEDYGDINKLTGELERTVEKLGNKYSQIICEHSYCWRVSTH